MFKTWLILTISSVFVVFILLTVNLMVFIESELMIEYLKQKTKVVIADSCIRDVFECVDKMLDESTCSLDSNSSNIIMKLEDILKTFTQNIKNEELLRILNISLEVNYDIGLQEYGKSYIIEIHVKVNVKDLEGCFILQREYMASRIIPIQEEAIS